jgi:hypothetical protein
MKACHLTYPTVPPIVRITQWLNKTKFIDHFFLSPHISPEAISEIEKLKTGSSYNHSILQPYLSDTTINHIKESKNPNFIYETLYTDDSLTTVLHKISIFLDKTSSKQIPYVWDNNSPLRFKIVNVWDGYNLNPFNCLSNPSDIANVQYKGEQLLSINQFNLIFYEDLKNIDANKLSYYFPNLRDTLSLSVNNIRGYINDQSILQRLWVTPRDKHERMSHKSICIYNRAIFKGVIKSDLNLIQIFNKIHTNVNTSFIQIIDDLNHIYYKVYKKHRIPKTLFDEWTNVDRINGDSQITLYSFIKETSLLYAQINIDHNKNVYFHYKLDFSENITYEQLEQHSSKILQELQDFLNVPKIKLEIENLSLRTNVLVENVNLREISRSFASLLPLYNIPSKNRIQKNLFDLQFKRIFKFGQTKNIREYIKSKMALDISILDIILDLQEYGLEENEVRDYFEEIRQEADHPVVERRKKDIRNIGLLMHLSQIPFGIQINIDNASSFHDIQNALFWTRASLLQWEQLNIKAPVLLTKKISKIIQKEEQPEEEEDEEEETIKITEIKSQPSSTSRSSSLDSVLSFGSEDMNGGAVGKEYHRFFNNMLKQIDPNIFALTKNYARKCGVSDLRQPIGITKTQKEIIDKSPYKDGYDNSIEYGSDPENKNVYICPRIWCPRSQVPLTPSQYEKEAKCPLDDEKPMLLYQHATWYNDPNIPHYVGYLKEKGYNNVKLPCCFKNLQKEEREVLIKKNKKDLLSETPKSVDDFKSKPVEEENYIIDKPRQLPDARFGTIPQSLHDFIYPNVPYQLCRSTIKTQECLLRRGVPNSKDTFLTSIAYLFGYNEKDTFIKHILKNLNPLIFIGLENGLVYKTFSTSDIIIPENNLGKRKELYQWLTKHKSYCKLIQMDSWMDELLKNDIRGLSTINRYQIARQLHIHQSYQHFIQYLKQDNEKNPQFFYDLFHHLGMLLVVWNRDNQSLATVKCPYVYKFHQWWIGQQTLLPFILILKQDDYYEPLVVVDPSKRITQRISFTKYQKIENLLSQCVGSDTNHDDLLLQSLYSLELWVENMLLNPTQFFITTVVLDYKLQIHAFMTKGNIWIDLPDTINNSTLSYLINLLPIDNIVFWEDIQGKAFDIVLPISDYRLFSSKIKLFGWGLQIGTIRESSIIKIKSLLTIPVVKYKELPLVLLRIEDNYQKRLDSIEIDNRQWYNVQKYILKELLKMDKMTSSIKELQSKFKHLNQKARVTVLLEELPLKNKKALQEIYDSLILKKYYQNTSKIMDGHYKKEWTFSQKSIDIYDLTFIINPLETYQQNIIPNPSNESVNKITLQEDILLLPDMLNESKYKQMGFPTKWRLTIWNEYKIYLLKDYTKTSFYQLIHWIAKEHHITFNPSELMIYTKKRIYELLSDRKNYPTIFEDASMRKSWNKVLKRQYRTMNELIEQGLVSIPISDIQNLWINVLENHSDSLWIQDIDLFNISRLLKINFFIIMKGKGADKKTDDLISSCKFICSYNQKEWKYRPIVLLYKEISDDKTHSVYATFGKNNKIGYYRQTIECPEELLTIIEKIFPTQ